MYLVFQRSIRLLSDLPFKLWVPTEADFSLLLDWLTSNPLDTARSKNSRVILSGMNWSFQEVDNVKPLPWQTHQRLAIAIGVTADIFMQDTAPAGILDESMKQVCH